MAVAWLVVKLFWKLRLQIVRDTRKVPEMLMLDGVDHYGIIIKEDSGTRIILICERGIKGRRNTQRMKETNEVIKNGLKDAKDQWRRKRASVRLASASCARWRVDKFRHQTLPLQDCLIPPGF